MTKKIMHAIIAIFITCFAISGPSVSRFAKCLEGQRQVVDVTFVFAGGLDPNRYSVSQLLVPPTLPEYTALLYNQAADLLPPCENFELTQEGGVIMMPDKPQMIIYVEQKGLHELEFEPCEASREWTCINLVGSIAVRALLNIPHAEFARVIEGELPEGEVPCLLFDSITKKNILKVNLKIRNQEDLKRIINKLYVLARSLVNSFGNPLKGRVQTDFARLRLESPGVFSNLSLPPFQADQRGPAHVVIFRV